jgi:uncharacterized protein (DUF2345 family)
MPPGEEGNVSIDSIESMQISAGESMQISAGESMPMFAVEQLIGMERPV